jgi:hypothetical protein
MKGEVEMKKMIFVFTLTVGVFCVVSAQETVREPFWNFDEVYKAPVTSAQSSTSTTAVAGVASSSVWDDMAKVFSTFVQGLSIRIW